MPLLLNQLVAVSVRIVTPWTGVWFADVDYDLDETLIPPFGPCVLTIGLNALAGTIDPRGSGIFGTKGKARVVGGGGGWDKPVGALHFHNDAGVLSSLVLAATAAEVLELPPLDALPSVYGPDYMRAAGPASQVLAGRDWYVNPLGVTIVGPRVPVPMLPTTDVVGYDPATKVVTLAGDDLITPGTILLSPMFGTATVRDVEQVFEASGATATAWCGDAPATSRLMAALQGAALAAVRPQYLKSYRYRVVFPGPDERPTLQIVDRTTGVPDAISISPWFGAPGMGAKLLPGSEVLVDFIAGDPRFPVVRSFQAGAPPLLLELDALLIQIGGPAAIAPLALSPPVLQMVLALQIEVAALSAALTAVLNIPGPITPAHVAAYAPALGAVTAAVAALAAAAPLLPSKKVVSL